MGLGFEVLELGSNVFGLEFEVLLLGLAVLMLGFALLVLGFLVLVHLRLPLAVWQPCRLATLPFGFPAPAYQNHVPQQVSFQRVTLGSFGNRLGLSSAFGGSAPYFGTQGSNFGAWLRAFWFETSRNGPG